MKVCKAELCSELELSLERGEMTVRFCELCLVIAKGHLIGRHGGDHLFVEDALSEFSLSLVMHWKKMEADGNPYGYVIRMAETRALNLLRGQNRYRVRIERYSEPIIACFSRLTGWKHE